MQHDHTAHLQTPLYVSSLTQRRTMGVHSLHIFDRTGKTLFTKRYAKADVANPTEEPEQLSEQRKLVFGMIFSLREITKLLAPSPQAAASGLHSVETGKCTLYQYETASGLRFALYCTNSNSSGGPGDGANTTTSTTSTNYNKAIRTALAHMYNELWIQCVTRSPLYRPTEPNVQDTNFEQSLDAFLKAQPWFA